MFSEESDKWILSHSRDAIFFVVSAYQVLHDLCQTADPLLVSKFPYIPLIWDSWPPSKVVVFSWQLLLDRFPFRENLFKRSVILDKEAISCILSGDWIKFGSPLVCYFLFLL